MIVTATNFKTNFKKYLELVQKEDILITKNGKVICQVTKPTNNKLISLRSLVGIASSNTNVTLDDIKEEKLKRQ